MNLIDTLTTGSFYHICTLFLGFRFVRFFIVYPTIFLTLYLLRAHIAKYRIQPKHASKKKIMMELSLSLSSFICFGLSTALALCFYKLGWYHFYFSWDQLGIPYFFLSILLIIALHEIYHYAYHRFMHTNNWFYRHVHGVHHKFSNPTAFTAYAFHPIEALLHPLAFVIAPLILPVYIFVPVIALLISEFFNVMGHMGYEWMPAKWMNKGLLRFVNTSTFHNYHHSHGGRKNYGMYTTVLDRLLGTHSEKSDIDLERVLAQRQKQSAK